MSYGNLSNVSQNVLKFYQQKYNLIRGVVFSEKGLVKERLLYQEI